MTKPTHPATRRLVACLFGALSLLAAPPAAAQGSHTIRVDGEDSVAFVVPRRAPAGGEPSILTTDGRVALVLRDTVVVLQLTDRGMERLFDRDTASRGLGGRVLARMVRAGISELFDHGIAYRLSALRAARAEGSRLVLEDREGHHVFEDTQINDHRPMEEFTPADAERFAAAVQRAIAGQARK